MEQHEWQEQLLKQDEQDEQDNRNTTRVEIWKTRENKGREDLRGMHEAWSVMPERQQPWGRYIRKERMIGPLRSEWCDRQWWRATRDIPIDKWADSEENLSIGEWVSSGSSAGFANLWRSWRSWRWHRERDRGRTDQAQGLFEQWRALRIGSPVGNWPRDNDRDSSYCMCFCVCSEWATPVVLRKAREPERQSSKKVRKSPICRLNWNSLTLYHKLESAEFRCKCGWVTHGAVPTATTHRAAKSACAKNLHTRSSRRIHICFQNVSRPPAPPRNHPLHSLLIWCY